VPDTPRRELIKDGSRPFLLPVLTHDSRRDAACQRQRCRPKALNVISTRGVTLDGARRGRPSPAIPLNRQSNQQRPAEERS